MNTVCYSVASEQAILKLLSNQFGLNNVLSCMFWCQGINDTFKISTITGQYMLRIYRYQWRSLPEIQYEVQALRLIQQSAPVRYLSAPLTHSDVLITELRLPEGKRYAMLTPWEEGEPVDISINQELSQYASTLAQLHRDSMCLSQSPPSAPITSAMRLDAAYQRIVPYLQQYALDCDWFADLIKRLSALLDSFSAVKMRYGFCHGDYVPNNAHYHQGKVFLFDFDCCGEGFQSYDLATFKWYCLTNNIELSVWETFISVYQQTISLSAVEHSAINQLVILKQILLMALHCETAVAKGWLSKHYFSFNISLLKRWDDGDFKAGQYRY